MTDAALQRIKGDLFYFSQKVLHSDLFGFGGFDFGLDVEEGLVDGSSFDVDFLLGDEGLRG